MWGSCLRNEAILFTGECTTGEGPLLHEGMTEILRPLADAASARFEEDVREPMAAIAC